MASQTPLNLIFFTDEKADNFHPLTLTRPLDDLRVGILTIREKWLKHLQLNDFSRLLPEYLVGVFGSRGISGENDYLWINARFLPSEKLINAIHKLKQGEQITFDGNTVAAIANRETTKHMFDSNMFIKDNFSNNEITGVIHLEHLWDLLALNSFEIDKDLPLIKLKPVSETGYHNGTAIQKPENVFVHETVKIEPGCILIGDDGPVIIQKGAVIEAGCILRGPVVIGENATLKMKARISGGTTIGPVCKVGGEVSNCIFHSYSNKAHEGFTGNSIFGQWVNLGADTNTSNLKNNYSTVRMADWNSKNEMETEVQFLGTIMGDHSKTAINTMLNTGTLCGVSSNIFMAGFPPKYISSFSWVGSADYGIYDFDKAIEAMKAMMKRRDIELTEDYKNMMHHIFKEAHK
ncbi:MAG: putative sugar nucleotidyl transferase [Gracilimonas sp.]